MGGLDEYLSNHTSGVVGIQEETVDAVALPESADLPPKSFLAIAKGLQLDDECTHIGTSTGNEVVAKHLLTVLDGRNLRENRVNLQHDFLGTLLRGGRRHRDRTEQRTGILIGHQTRLGGKHRNAQHHDTRYHSCNDGHWLTNQLLEDILILANRRIESRIE